MMHAMVLRGPGEALVLEQRPLPEPKAGEVLLQVHACGVCRTDLHVVDGELPAIPYPIIPGHEIVGEVIARGPGVNAVIGARVGVPWLGWTCGECEYCRRGQENLCRRARFTGYQRDGGYASHVVADTRFCFPVPPEYGDVDAAPLLCAGLIGFRSLHMAGDGARIGIYGFGAAAHIVAQVARFQGREIYAFTRAGDRKAQEFALELGAVWAGSSEDTPPVLLDAALIFAPVGELVPAALRAVRPGGIVVCGGIHMSDIPSFPYRILWEERKVVSVANLTRQDGTEFLALAPRVPVHTQTESYPLARANEALARLRAGKLTGAAVLVP